jgi:ankyrin repeat protein
VQAGANTTLKDKDGHTALHTASWFWHYDSR